MARTRLDILMVERGLVEGIAAAWIVSSHAAL